MDRPAARRVLPVVIAATAVVFAVAAAWAVYELRAHGILPVFEGPYIGARALALSIDAVAAAWIAAVMLHAGRAPRKAGGDRPSARRLALWSVAVACGYAVLSVTVQPRAARDYETMRRMSAEAGELARQARDALQRQDLPAAAAAMQGYLAIDPTDPTWRRLADDTRKALEDRAPARPQAAPAPPAPAEPAVDDLLAAARRSMESEDYAAAYAFLLRAEAISPGRRDTRDLRRQAAEALGRLGPDAAERARVDLYRIKEQARAALGRGDPVAAYYVAERGTRAHPRDGELLELRGLAEKAMEAFAFFRDTVGDPEQVPRRDRVRRVAFVNRSEPGLVEVVYADSVVRVPRSLVVDIRRRDGTMGKARRYAVEVTLHDIEVMAFGRGGVVYHMRAPVGRLLAGPREAAPAARDWLAPPTGSSGPLARIALLALHRSDEADRLAPMFLAGTERRFAQFGSAAAGQDAGARAAVLPLFVPPDALWTAGLDLGSVRERNVVELWTLLRARPSLDVRVELALRAAGPVVLVILAALAAALAARSVPPAPPGPGAYILAPAAAAAGHMAFVLALHGVRVAVVSLAAALGWVLGLAALAALLAALVVLGLLAMDGALRRQR